MKVIHLLRHTKSAWDDEALDDHERPLAPRGAKAAKAIGRFLEATGARPDLVLTSTAARARETAALALAHLGGAVKVEADRSLYLCGAGGLIARLSGLDDKIGCVMVVGHNPDLQDAARKLAPDGDAGLRKALVAKYPTGGLATLVVPATHWRDLGRESGVLAAFVTPRALAPAGGEKTDAPD